MSEFKRYMEGYEFSIISENFNLNDDVINIPEVSFIDKENYLTSQIDEKESVIEANSKLLIDVCRRIKKALDDIYNCIRTYGYSENIDFIITEQYIDALLIKIRSILNDDDICDIIDELGDDLIFLENFCKNKNVKKLDEILQKIQNIIENFKKLENY
jgi:hypothetical protein